ncbi:MAG: hypothetical protein ABSF91_02835 [Bacteroidota bacterium]
MKGRWDNKKKALQEVRQSLGSFKLLGLLRTWCVWHNGDAGFGGSWCIRHNGDTGLGGSWCIRHYCDAGFRRSRCIRHDRYPGLLGVGNRYIDHDDHKHRHEN